MGDPYIKIEIRPFAWKQIVVINNPDTGQWLVMVGPFIFDVGLVEKAHVVMEFQYHSKDKVYRSSKGWWTVGDIEGWSKEKKDGFPPGC